jgi:hypothetical protein
MANAFGQDGAATFAFFSRPSPDFSPNLKIS